ncbi:hypothetical protein LTR64_005494 [Lithohypha guttulata]|uniref:Uncharacterized protein n=1 Tax=Lithohypha guttulata TaxID=1690604 RepID=A0AAN7Y4R2_9EURO|nr:hypothetical protein LTR51_002714 [Lithohypha guttulata]KAK5082897.1 hypothetical protein LTR05_006778 [Lithohypha guttulata]
MESAPLTLAYTHARNAAQETKRANPVAASEEHDLAAAEFATAAASTTDQEALRVLHLLEQHHKQLALILKDSHAKPSRHTEVDKKQTATEADRTDDSPQPPRLPHVARNTARDLSSSIASNLATKRGIPSVRQKRNIPALPLVSNEYADGAFTQDSPQGRKVLGPAGDQQVTRPSWAPPASVVPQADTASSNASSPFQQFYNKFEGVISTLTAPLAFASLPLSQPPAYQKEDGTTSTSRRPSTKVLPKSDPSPAALDYSQLISNAALRAVRDNNDSGYSRPHESFLLVPTSGGTMSYADITAANYVDRELARNRHHGRVLSNASNDDFVDASSQILSHPSGSLLQATQKMAGRSLSNADKWQSQILPNGQTAEEIVLQNQVLRKTLNDVGKRLHSFELASQDMRLAQSRHSLQLSPITTPENSRGKMLPVSSGRSNDAGVRMAQQRIEELEEALRKNDRRLSKREDENVKLKETLAKYREKWEGLKAGAKARREQAGGGDKLRRASSTATAVAVVTPTKDRDKAAQEQSSGG